MSRAASRAAALLWAAWGLLHFVMSFPFVMTLRGPIPGLPPTVTLEMGGEPTPLHLRETLMEHGFNNGWFGLVVTIGSLFVWRGHRHAIYLCSIVGGMAQLGFTLFLVLPGRSNPVGATMTAVAATAVVTGLLAARQDRRAPR